jgi:uncharacterized membrane protein
VRNYIEDLLLVIGRGKAHGHGELRDPDGRLRLVVPLRHFEQYLDLGVTEIRQYGAHSVQVTRRLRALLEELRSLVPWAKVTMTVPSLISMGILALVVARAVNVFT